MGLQQRRRGCSERSHAKSERPTWLVRSTVLKRLPSYIHESGDDPQPHLVVFECTFCGTLEAACLWYGQAHPHVESRYGSVLELPSRGGAPAGSRVRVCVPLSSAFARSRPFSQIIHAYSSSRPGSTPRAARCGGYIPSPGPKHGI